MLRAVHALVLALAFASQLRQPSEADWEWLSRTRDTALEGLMPVTARPKPLVAYRAYRDLYQDVPEVYFRIELDPSWTTSDDLLLASLVAPVGASAQQQLLTLHMANRSASLESLLPRVAVGRIVVDSRVCPAVRSRVDGLSHLSISVPKRDAIALHPFVHRVVINSAAAQIDATLFDNDAPVVQWAAETARAIQACRDR